jgi:hypothetical protein
MHAILNVGGIFDIFQIFNPFHWLAKAINGLTDGLVSSFQQVFIHPPRPMAGPWQDYLYGNAIGIAGILSVTICILVLVVAMFFQRRLASLGVAFVVALAIGTIYPVYFLACDWIVAAGDDLAQSAHWYHHGSDKLLSIPDIANVLGSIIGLGSITFTGGMLVVIFFIYELIIIVVKFFGLIALAASPAGERARRFLSWIVAVGIVTMLLGRAFAVFAVDLGRMASDHFPFASNSFGKTFFITTSLLLAIVLQGVLIWAMLRVSSHVVGHVHSRVFGQVESLNRRRESMSGMGGIEAHLATKGSIPMQDPVTDVFAADRGRTRTAAAMMGGAVAMRAANALHPAAGTALALQRAKRRSNNGHSSNGNSSNGSTATKED